MQFIVMSGSNKTVRPSINNALVEAVKELAPAGVEIVEANIKELPMYSEDHDDNYPEAALQLKELIRSADALIVATPEYNRSIPPVLSNAIAWTTRPYPDNAWDGKPVVTMGVSGGGIATYAAQSHLRDILTHIKSLVLPVHLYVGGAGDKIENGVLQDSDTKQHIKTALAELVIFTNKLQK